MNNLIPFLCIICLANGLSDIVEKSANLINQQSGIKWDGLLFSQQWPLTSCIDHLMKRKDGSCTLYINMTSWSIHGLWPTKTGTRGPNFCNPSWKFNFTKLQNIKPYLLKYWPNIYGETTLTSLWQHEWDKHGTCAAQSAYLDSEYKYFDKGINLAIEYDLVSILGIKKIYPNDENPYSISQIYSAIQEYTGHNPIIDCTYNKETNRHEISQIKICFDPDFHLIDCDSLQTPSDVYQKSNHNSPVKISSRESDLNMKSSFKKWQDLFTNLNYVHANQGNCPEKNVFYPASVQMNNMTYYYSPALFRRHVKSWILNRQKCDFANWLLDLFKGLSLVGFNS